MIDILEVREATQDDMKRIKGSFIIKEERMTDRGMKIIIKENHPQIAKGKMLKVLPL